MASLVLVPSPYLGASSWQTAGEELRRLGNEVALADLSAGPWHWEHHVAAVCEAVRGTDRPPVVCVVHSGAGAWMPAIEENVIVPVRWLMVDASAPHPGVSRWDDLPEQLRDAIPEAVDGLLPPWHRWFEPGTLERLLPEARVRRALFAEMPSIPMVAMQSPLPVTADWPESPGAYLQLSGGYAEVAAEAKQRGWTIERFDGHHLSMVTHAAAVAGVIDRMSRGLGDS